MLCLACFSHYAAIASLNIKKYAYKMKMRCIFRDIRTKSLVFIKSQLALKALVAAKQTLGITVLIYTGQLVS